MRADARADSRERILLLAHLIGSETSHDLNPLSRIRSRIHSRIRSHASALICHVICLSQSDLLKLVSTPENPLSRIRSRICDGRSVTDLSIYLSQMRERMRERILGSG